MPGWLADEGSSIPDGGTTTDVARAIARRFGVPYRNQSGGLVVGGLGRQALAIRLETGGLARIHEEALVALMSPSRSSGPEDGIMKRAQETGS